MSQYKAYSTHDPIMPLSSNNTRWKTWREKTWRRISFQFEGTPYPQNKSDKNGLPKRRPDNVSAKSTRSWRPMIKYASSGQNVPRMGTAILLFRPLLRDFDLSVIPNQTFLVCPSSIASSSLASFNPSSASIWPSPLIRNDLKLCRVPIQLNRACRTSWEGRRFEKNTSCPLCAISNGPLTL